MRLFLKTTLPVVLCAMAMGTNAQDTKETTQPLSKKAVKGYMVNAVKEDGGNATITYQIPGNKKSDAASFEEYTFDNDLKLVSDKEVEVKKESHEDRERTFYNASVGGCNSFEVLSMKLRLNKVVVSETWDRDKQKYVYRKTLSRETIKAKNDNGKVYYGYASYTSEDEKKSDVFALAKIEAKDKGEADKFYVLHFNSNLEIKEQPIDLQGAYSLVYCDQLANENVIMVFAPMKGAADLAKYVYFEYDIDGTLKNRIEFKSPSTALLITATFENNGSVYLCGSSSKGANPFEKVFAEYCPIVNPCYSGGGNKLDDKWQKASEEEMANFHLLKFNGGSMTFATTTPVAEFKSKFKKSPSGKGTPYKGSKFYIEQFYVTANEDYIIAGQLTSKVNLGLANPMKAYGDLVCFQFDKNGTLKAQYGVEKINTDKKSEIFEMKQNFYLSGDGKNLYWEILEVQGEDGYASFMDAYNDTKTFYPKYFPRVAKIDLSSSSLGDFKVLGNGKYFLNKRFTGTFDPKEKSKTYIGQDDKGKTLWLGKVTMP